jgi:hypothetical protein
MAVQGREVAMLTILLATCEKTLETLTAADNPIEPELMADLEKIVERTRKEIDVLTG